MGRALPCGDGWFRLILKAMVEHPHLWVGVRRRDPVVTLVFPNAPIAPMKTLAKLCLLAWIGLAWTGLATQAAEPETKKIVLIAGRPSHGPGDHEHNAGVLLFQKCLKDVPGIKVEAHLNGWVRDDATLDDADAVLIFSDGGGGHPVLRDQRLKRFEELAERGVGIAMIHYAVEVPKDRAGKQFLDFTGGYFETFWSVNPFWTAEFKELPDHPITRGVEPFSIRDEWYFHMRFREGMEGVTPILTAVPPDNVYRDGNSAHGANPHVRETKGQAHHVAWAAERPNGGRGFGFTGGHMHRNWGDDNFRKVVLNAILWIAHVEVPENGVESTVTEDDLKENLDPK